MNHLLTLAAAICLSAAPALAGQTSAAANNGAAAQTAAQPQSAAQTEAELQAQYQSDLATYQQALDAHDHKAQRDQAHYDHQRRAYADAMAAWRHQVWACHHGSNRACNAPTPEPAAYY
jgi:Skp family chaperone for outer membrane proteins